MEKFTDQLAALRDQALRAREVAHRLVDDPDLRDDSEWRSKWKLAEELHDQYADDLDAILACCGEEEFMLRLPDGRVLPEEACRGMTFTVDDAPVGVHVIEIKETPDA